MFNIEEKMILNELLDEEIDYLNKTIDEAIEIDKKDLFQELKTIQNIKRKINS